MRKKILFVTERRADYSKLRPVINEIKKSKKFDYYLVVTGSHLLKKHGYTINEIKNDGFHIYKKFKMFEENDDDSPATMTMAFGKAVINLTKIIKSLKPDLIFSGFDIGANFAAAIIGAHMNIHVAHLEGGEITGTIDESIRHAISKFAHIHFTSNTQATKRLIKMGELPKNIFTVGNPSLDVIKSIKFIPKKKLEDEFNINLEKPLLLVVQHTVTTEINKIDKYFSETINAIKDTNIQTIIISGNVDAGSQKIKKIIKNSNISNYENLPFIKYISLLYYSSAIIGNSSSGIMEAPFLHIPSINIGTRQEGRGKTKSIINVKYDKNKIKMAINKVLTDKKFLNSIKKQKNQHGNGIASKKIIQILEKLNFENISIQKKLAY
ncbi:UDP-N-acetyl glucosamine 2-epimerase [Nitrosopumilus zosterae]|uniref:UDP-N-acetyl glucosamine 2-epimerase n=1 Tax=Nitrosopumilus zosterae TaxID=718286 RepID=A0A2S2KU94_9ARCH|nr:UDP-N-acetylglucosamine 2-epimerase [Nitrosopumilus zosterae]BDQ31836.1 UDP-N-acetylglucosamine 2-epimerase [Nitrosopumilus zosterae]GBH35186.1 UDP-N-acetyl glucosamine 2-epimerase [Nitrosopumilus zosterae]